MTAHHHAGEQRQQAQDQVRAKWQLAAAFLAIIAGFIALSLFSVARKKAGLAAWRFLLAALVVFVVVEVVGALRTFGFDVAPSGHTF